MISLLLFTIYVKQFYQIQQKCKLFSKDLDMIWEQILLKKRVRKLGGSNNQPSDFA